MREYIDGKIGPRIKAMNSRSEQEIVELALDYYKTLTVAYKVGQLIPPDNNPNIQALLEKLATLTLLEKVQGGYRLKDPKQSN